MFEEYNNIVMNFFQNVSNFIVKYVDEEDFKLTWEKFKEKHPLAIKFDYDIKREQLGIR